MNRTVLPAALALAVVLAGGLLPGSGSAADFDIDGYCKRLAGDGYGLELACIKQETVAKQEVAASPASAPVKRYCETVARAGAGGSYAILKACIDQETAAKASLERRAQAGEIPNRIMAYCTRIGQTGGAGFALIQACADEELRAKKQLGR